MYDPKFEKEVQRKMEELEFSPSEAVWTNIEREVGRDKKRRRVPFFWLLLAPALLLSGAGIGYFVFRPSSPAASAVRVNVPAGAVVAKGTNSPATTVPATTTNSSATVAPVARGTAEAPVLGAGRQRLSSPGAAEPAAGQSIVATQGAAISGQRHGDGQRKGITTRKEAPAVQADDSQAGVAGSTELAGSGMHARRAGDQAAGSAVPVAGSQDAAGGSTASVVGSGSHTAGSVVPVSGSGTLEAGPQLMSARAHGAYVPGLERSFLPAPKITAAGLATQKAALVASTQKNLLAAGKLPTPKRPWEAGFTGGIGVSDLKQGLFGSSNHTGSNDLVYMAALNPSLVTSYGAAAYGAPIKNYVSDIRPDLSFSAGILARKPLSPRWAVTVGLNLQYYSARLRIGQQVSGYTPQTASLIYNANSAPIQTYPYYSTGNDQMFTNRYYTLEIPASIQWQINHSRVIPLFWEAGASLSYLMSSDALYYDPHSGVYFKDASVINRTQVNLSTSVMAGLPLGGVRLQVGPQVQYGLTSLLNTQAAGGQHILYGGIRVVLIPVKKKN